jgi:hypothetical protein
MICWLSRQEKVNYFDHLLSSRLSSRLFSNTSSPSHPLTIIQATHNAPQFQCHLKQYINNFLSDPLPSCQLETTHLPFNNIDVYSMFRFHPEIIQDDNEECDIVRAVPCSSPCPRGRFDTVIVIDNDIAEATGLEGITIGISFYFYCSYQL